MASPSYMDIEEKNYQLGTMTEDEERTIASKNLSIYENDSRFWGPGLELGRVCFDYVNGDIFSPAEKADYKLKDKYVITNPELLPKMNALEGMQIAGRRNGVIVPVGSEDAPDGETANNILLSMQSETHMKREMTDAFVSGMISSYPQFLWFSKSPSWAKTKTCDIFHPPWDSIIPDPHFKRSDYSDAQRITRLILCDKETLKRDYPNRAEQIDKHIHVNQFQAGNFGTSIYTSAQRDGLFYKAKAASQQYDETGQILVVERNHMIFASADVWISPNSEKPEILPQEWSKEEVQKWQQENQDYQMVNRVVRLLWVTTSTTTGFLLENARHWYQEDDFPCEIFIPKMLNNKPHGMVEYLRGSLKGKNVARIEHLHSLRLANDNIWKVKAGSVDNMKDMPSEIARAGGVIVVNEDREMTDVEAVENRREQVGWSDASNEFQGDMDRIFLDRNVEGSSQSSQESGKAIQRRIEQGQLKQSPYLDSYNGFDLRSTKKTLNMLPYAFTEYHMFRYVKSDNKPGSVEVNVPQEFDWATGAVTKLKNNLAGAKYDYREAFGDDSVTGREYELKVFVDVLHNVLPSMPDVSLWPTLLGSVPNRLANEFGRRITDMMASKDDGPPPPKLSFAFTGEDLLYNPLAQSVLQQAGYGAQPGGTPPGGQAPVRRPAQPSKPTPQASAA